MCLLGAGGPDLTGKYFLVVLIRLLRGLPGRRRLTMWMHARLHERQLVLCSKTSILGGSHKADDFRQSKMPESSCPSSRSSAAKGISSGSGQVSFRSSAKSRFAVVPSPSPTPASLRPYHDRQWTFPGFFRVCRIYLCQLHSRQKPRRTRPPGPELSATALSPMQPGARFRLLEQVVLMPMAVIHNRRWRTHGLNPDR